MTTVLESITIADERTNVFHVAQDYGLRLDWDPFLDDIKFISEDTKLQRGLEVWVRAHNGMEMTVRYLNYKEPSHVSMKMTNGPWIFREFSGVWIFEELTDERTKVTFKYQFTPKWYLTLGSFIIRKNLSKDMRGRLEALKSYCEIKS